MGNVLLFKLTATLQAHETSLKFSSLGKSARVGLLSGLLKALGASRLRGN
jgi:hypothetical protein